MKVSQTRQSFNRARRVLFIVVSAWLVVPGCGGGDSGNLPTAPVSGTLSVEGKPVAAGAIHFHPQKGQAASGIVKDGKFTLTTYNDGDGAIVGKHRVALEVVEEVPTADGDTTTKSLLPKKFSSPDSSGIELEIPAAGRPNLQINVVGSTIAVKEG
jgi:hypothetical protein